MPPQPPQPAPPAADDGQGAVSVPADPNAYADTDPSALTDFHSTLDSHGEWVDDPTYGTVWVPSSEEVGSDFAPYNTHGHWAYDNDEYVWVSDYDWGWAPFHYGRWTYVGGTGWAWIPGRTYAGAWVEWRDGGAGYPYVGWAPMPPAYGWRGGVAVGLRSVPAPAYVYTGHGDIFSPGVHDHLVPPDRVPEVAAHTTPFTPQGGAGGGVASNGRGIEHPTAMHGPTPASMGIAPSAIPHSSATSAAPGFGPSAVAHSGGGGGATPGVAPSDVAHSAAGGNGRMGAAPGVTPTDVAHSSASGTSPNLGTSPTAVSGVDRAKAFGNPATAVANGAHAPAPHTYRPVTVEKRAPATHYVAATTPHVGVRTGGRHR